MNKINLHDASEEAISRTEFNVFGDFEKIDSSLSAMFNSRLTELNKYIALAENPSDFNNEIKRIQLFGNLSYGLRKASEGLAIALYHQKQAKARRKKEEASAAMYEFGSFVAAQKEAGNDVKVTDKNKEYYVALDRKVLLANEYESMMDAYVEHFSGIRYEFSQAISTLRAMCYGLRDSQNISGMSGNMEG
jgi:hypothetical protein